MPITIASEQFESTLDYAALPQAKLLELFQQTILAHQNFFQMWQRAITDKFGSQVCALLTAEVYPSLADVDGKLEQIFYQELNFLWQIMPNIQQMLTFARYDSSLLPKTLDRELDIEGLSKESLVILWNVATLTYVMQTGRWTDLLTERYDQDTALKMERAVWLDYGGAEEDLRYGLIAAGSESGDVETLLRGFQMAPGEVGLVDAHFSLENANHGFITHKRCPSKDRFGESNKERLESNCVLCVIAMRKSGEMVNKAMRCRAVDIPPYREATDYACKWEYWL
jgi:hypothetical protein